MVADHRGLAMSIDLASVPWSLPGSRLLAFVDAAGLHLLSAEYERSYSECVFARDVQVRINDTPAAATATPEGVAWDRVHMFADGPNALLITNDGTEPAQLSISELTAPVGQRLHLHVSNTVKSCQPTPNPVFHLAPGSWVAFALLPVESPVPEWSAPATARAETTAAAKAWMDRCPEVALHLTQITQLCWYALGVNTISLRLPEVAARQVVVPSVLGYVGHWQWDAYFIAIGLRHGDRALAREQLELAFEFCEADGQLQDVIHDTGFIRGFADLPPEEIDAYAKQSGMAPDELRTIPITKPPLGAWAVRQVEDIVDDAWVARMLPILERSHQWWWSASVDPTTGLPSYAHPFSSGLDDSPVFDSARPRTTPDLLAYLWVQERALDALAARIHLVRDNASADARCAKIEHALESLWNESEGLYQDTSAVGSSGAETILGLMPLLIPTLPEQRQRALRIALADPNRFSGAIQIPTVARRERRFNATQMWRGPVWMNTNFLMITALEAVGAIDEAHHLAERTLAMVQRAGGPYEYYDANTGQPPARSVPCFSWSAALCVELAVRLSTGHYTSAHIQSGTIMLPVDSITN